MNARRFVTIVLRILPALTLIGACGLGTATGTIDGQDLTAPTSGFTYRLVLYDRAYLGAVVGSHPNLCDALVQRAAKHVEARQAFAIDGDLDKLAANLKSADEAALSLDGWLLNLSWHSGDELNDINALSGNRFDHRVGEDLGRLNILDTFEYVGGFALSSSYSVTEGHTAFRDVSESGASFSSELGLAVDDGDGDVEEAGAIAVDLTLPGCQDYAEAYLEYYDTAFTNSGRFYLPGYWP